MSIHKACRCRHPDRCVDQFPLSQMIGADTVERASKNLLIGGLGRNILFGGLLPVLVGEGEMKAGLWLHLKGLAIVPQTVEQAGRASIIKSNMLLEKRV